MAEQQAGFRIISDEAVRASPGRGWQERFAILDGCDARAMGHTKSARHLRDEHGVSPWWAQAVTIRYEYERGIRG